MSSALHYLTRDNVRFDWGADQQQSFSDLKTALTTAPVVAYPTDEGKLEMYCDASQKRIASMAGNLRPGNSSAIGQVVIDHGLRTVRYGLNQATTYLLLARNDVLHSPHRFCTAPEYVSALQLLVDREPDRVDEGFLQARLFLRQLANDDLPERYYLPASSPSSSSEEDEDFAARFIRPVSPAFAEAETESSEEEQREE
ncbi:unnamed protein product [Allacma fusca]|uniref:Reverse transcriptase/retrotransposon-derived protein RNase H-like domain-containing protein n=1 Tax=Allacma fusca TaxID=39272 RepID=A0A8J2NYN3_9HEXA|nr:unnamed protein product [Allacma fusca]